MKNIKHILFDTDGVLVHAEPWSIRYAREANITADMQVFFRGVFQDCILGKADLKQVLVPYLKEWGWSGTVDEYLQNWFDSENLPDKELLKDIQALRSQGVPCYVATNQEKYRLAYLRDKMGFARDFDGIFCSAEMGVKKPQKEFFDQILTTLKVQNPTEVVYFDDSAENIEIANSLGIKGVVYRTSGDFLGVFQK